MCSVEDQTLEPVYAVLDVETTGLNRKKDRIIQIGVVKVGHDVQTPWMTFVNPIMSTESQMAAFGVHKISPDVLTKKPTFKEVAPKLCTFLKDVEYVVAYNALFDWSMLVEEFGRLQSDAEREEGKKLLEKIKWIDMYRLAIKTLPDDKDLRAGTLFKKFSIHIRTKKIQSFHHIYHLSCANPHGEEPKVFSSSETEETSWEEGLHDALCDALATNSLLKKLLKLNGYSSIVDVANNMPYCRLDTELFLTVNKMLKEGKTSDEDLMAIAARAGEYYGTMSSLRGKTLAESPKRKIREAYNALYLSEERRDERLGLILTARLLLQNQSIHQNDSPPEMIHKKPKRQNDFLACS